MPEIFQLKTLPDDILRAVATFLPPSGLIVLVRSCRTLATVLQDQLAHRLDNLFYQMHYEIQCTHPLFSELPTQPLPCELQDLFGEASFNKLGVSSYYFLEVKGYDGPRRYFQLYRLPTGYVDHRCKIASSRNDGQIRFVAWLQRRLERLRAAGAQSDATTASAPLLI
jgi:hypothetical protein